MSSSQLTYTAGIPAVDHHSHAGYIRPGEAVAGVDAIVREYAMGHLEANIPHHIYQEFTQATLAEDSHHLDQLDSDFGTEQLIEAGIRFQQTTVHGRSLTDGCRALYGDRTWEDWVSLSTQERIEDPTGLYDRALRLTGTAAVLTDIPWIDSSVWPHSRYKPIARIDPYLYPFGHPDFQRRGADTPRFRRIFSTVLGTLLARQGLAELPSTLDEYWQFLAESIRERQQSGFVGLKIASAYVRSLAFEPRERADAEAAYQALRSHGPHADPQAYELLTDHLVFSIAELAVDLELPLQIHTGMGHTEPGLQLKDADPRNLARLISDPRLNQLRIILIHGGYPYTSILPALSQAHGNLFVDFSWMPYLQHHTVERLLQEWLEVLPANKVIFGTDTGQPEFHVPATDRTRLLLDRALESGVADRIWTHDQASWLAERVLHQNLCDVYGVSLP